MLSHLQDQVMVYYTKKWLQVLADEHFGQLLPALHPIDSQESIVADREEILIIVRMVVTQTESVALTGLFFQWDSSTQFILQIVHDQGLPIGSNQNQSMIFRDQFRCLFQLRDRLVFVPPEIDLLIVRMKDQVFRYGGEPSDRRRSQLNQRQNDHRGPIDIELDELRSIVGYRIQPIVRCRRVQ